MTAASAESVKKLATFKKCQRLISRYALARERLQRNIFETYHGAEEIQFLNNGFFDNRKLDSMHKNMCAKFSKSNERCETPCIEELIEAWHALMNDLKMNHELTIDSGSTRACQYLMKFIIGFCLLEAQYYEALQCTYELLHFTHFEDSTCWILCLLWSLRLEEWELLGHLLAKEQRMKKWPLTEGYYFCVDCVRLAYRLSITTDNSQREQIQIVNNLIDKLQFVTRNDDKKTFLYTQSKAILRTTLIMASRLPNANIEKIGDPLHQRELELAHYMAILRTYLPAYFQSSQSPSIHSKLQSAEEFVRFCAAYADYTETMMAFCWDCWDVGQVQEAESQCLLLWRDNLRFGSAYWTLRPLSLLFHIRSSISLELHYLKHFAACIQALLTPQMAASSYYLRTPKRNIRPSTFRRGSAVDDSFEYCPSDEENGEETTNGAFDTMSVLKKALQNSTESSRLNIGQNIREKYQLEAHVTNCECTFCVCRRNNWAMALEMEWLKLLFQMHSSTQFMHFQQALVSLRDQKIEPLRQRLFNYVFDSMGIVTNTPRTLADTNECHSQRNLKLTHAPKKRGRPPKNRQPSEKENQQQQQQWMQIEIARKEENIAFTPPIMRQLQNEISIQPPAIESDHIPSIWAFYWTKAVNTMFLHGLTTSVKELEKANKFCHRYSLSNRAEWLLLRHFQRLHSSEMAISPSNSAYTDFRDFGHLLVREWRWRCCHYLASIPRHLAQSNEENDWLKALFHTESMLPTLRQFVRTCLSRKSANKKCPAIENGTTNSEQEPTCSLQLETDKNKEGKEDVSTHLIFQHVNQLQSYIQQLPRDITFVNLSLDESGALFLTRFHALHEPIIHKLCDLEKNDLILTKMAELMHASGTSVKNDVNNDDEAQPSEQKDREQQERQRAAKFWEERKRLDREMELLLRELQSKWLSDGKAPLLLPLNSTSSKGTTIVNSYIKRGIAKASAVTLVHLLDRLEEQQWTDLASLLRGKQIGKNDTWSELRKMTKTGREKRNMERQYTLLIVPPALSHLPWECLPIFKRSPLVMRIPSLHFFEHLMQNLKEIPKTVDGQNSFYVLNPDGDLANTQKRIAEFFEQFKWPGMIGKVPSREEIQMVLAKNDLFFYIGHGSGGRYFGRSSMRDRECRAVSLLMGCSSVKIQNEGYGFDGRSILYEYMSARCPCVVGCLWMVTDGEIDRFFMALIEYCFAEFARKDADELERANKHGRQQRLSVAEETLKLLAEGMVRARSRCKLPYLTGASVVAYGLPVVASGRHCDVP